jgi:hypothetical protein
MDFNTLAKELSLFSIFLRFLLNVGVLFVLIRLLYYRYTKKVDYLFSFFILGIVIFLICVFLGTISINLGLGLGLFAIFSILRFRTVSYTVKDMTYMFTVIGISVINAYANIPPALIGALGTNLTILAAIFILEMFLKKNGLNSLIVIYNNPELIAHGSGQDLLKDLSSHTGHTIEKVNILKIDIRKGNAEVEVFYRDPTGREMGRPANSGPD